MIGGGSVALAMLGVFACLAFIVAHDPGPTAIDQSTAACLKQLRAEIPALVPVLTILTNLGDLSVLLCLGVVVCLFLAIRRQWLLLAAWMVAQASGAVLNHFLKDWFERPRPPDGVSHFAGFSFPSGHSMSAAIAYGMLIYLVMRGFRRGWQRLLLVGLLSLVILVIGFTRMFLGAHWGSDVLGGFAAGTGLVAVCATLVEMLRGRLRQITHAGRIQPAA
jgi:membrane-associated phospholipid phosphatase